VISGLNVSVSSAAMLQNNRKMLRSTMRRAGAEVLAVAKAKITKGGGGAIYRGGGGTSGGFRSYLRGRFQASSPGAAPASITGTLRKSGKVRPFKSGEGVAVRFSAFYAKILEGGAKGGGNPHGTTAINKRTGKHKRARGVFTARVLKPRPFLSAAMDQRRSSIDKRVRDAVTRDIQFVRVKP
jgi:hypothetical protein